MAQGNKDENQVQRSGRPKTAMDVGKATQVSVSVIGLLGRAVPLVMSTVNLVQEAAKDGSVSDDEMKKIHDQIDQYKDLVDEVLRTVRNVRTG